MALTNRPPAAERVVPRDQLDSARSAAVRRDEAALAVLEPNPGMHQLLFVYGTSLGIGLHIALLQLALFRSWSGSLFTVGASLLFATLALVLWQTVFRRSARYALPWRLIYQSVVALVSLM